MPQRAAFGLTYTYTQTYIYTYMYTDPVSAAVYGNSLNEYFLERKVTFLLRLAMALYV